MTDRTRRAWLILAGLGAGVVLLAAGAAAAIARRLAAPLERVAGAARRLGDGDFSARSPAAGIPELDAVGAALDATAERLGRLVTRERAFSADASHQLRTPLAALRIELEAIELRPDPPPELAPALGQVDRLQTTVDTLLSVARDAPRVRERVALGEVVAELEASWRGRLAARGRPLRTAIDTAVPGVRVSRAVLIEILTVLLANAERHGSGAVWLTVRDAPPGSVAVEVSDEGPGITGPSPEAVFTRRSGRTPGHGIGLALARSLAEAEGGRLALARAGPAPVFTLLLPRGQA